MSPTKQSAMKRVLGQRAPTPPATESDEEDVVILASVVGSVPMAEQASGDTPVRRVMESPTKKFKDEGMGMELGEYNDLRTRMLPVS